MTFQSKPENKACGRCGKTFDCSSKSKGCWCESLPPLPKAIPDCDCLCPECLEKEIQHQKLIGANHLA